MVKETIGPKIKQIRKQRKLTQEELAKSLGYSGKSVISHIEKGDADMTYEKILLLIRTYCLDANELFEVEKIDKLSAKASVLVTDRLILRKVKKKDAEPMFNNWANDPEVTKYMTWLPHQNIETTKYIVNEWIKQEEDPKTIRYMITIKGSDEPIGSIDVVDYIDGVPELGYCLSRKYWNKGYMTEACKALIKHLFDIGYTKILIEADVRNIGSNRVIEKCGFKFTHKEDKEHSSSLKPEPITVNWYEIIK